MVRFFDYLLRARISLSTPCLLWQCVIMFRMILLWKIYRGVGLLMYKNVQVTFWDYLHVIYIPVISQRYIGFIEVISGRLSWPSSFKLLFEKLSFCLHIFSIASYNISPFKNKYVFNKDSHKCMYLTQHPS